MNITIQNFRGIASATLDLSKICLLAGPNEAGKTSAVQATIAALTGEPIPIIGVKKTQAGMLVRSGTANGSVTLTGPNGSTNIVWPSAKVKTEGQAPYASPFATGLQSIVYMDDKERVKVLTEYLKAAPVRADLDAQLAPMGLSAKNADQIWKRIEESGWDGALKYYEQQRAQTKGQWLEVTGESYGSKKAESWLPEGYEYGLEAESKENLEAIVTDARDALKATISATAVDDSKQADNEALAALLPGRKIDLLAAENATVDPALSNQLKECQEYIASISEKRDALNQQLKELPQPSQTTGMECPECKALLKVEGGKLQPVTCQLTDEEITTRREAITELQERIRTTNDAIAKHMESAAAIKKRIADAETARVLKIAECKRLVEESEQAAQIPVVATSSTSTITVSDGEKTLARAETRLRAFISKAKADQYHKSIEALEILIVKIAPDGIRGDVLAKALKGFNDSLAPISKAAGWRTVTLESDFMPTYGGTIYLLLSESAKFRVRTILAIGMALLDKSQALIVDAADILDKTGRNGLFKALQACKLPALVAMTMDTVESVPNLGKAGIGASYWINGNAVAELV